MREKRGKREKERESKTHTSPTKIRGIIDRWPVAVCGRSSTLSLFLSHSQNIESFFRYPPRLHPHLLRLHIFYPQKSALGRNVLREVFYPEYCFIVFICVLNVVEEVRRRSISFPRKSRQRKRICELAKHPRK